MLCCQVLPATLTKAVPVPEPAPVATNAVPTLLLAAPIATKLVVPTVAIMYVCPITKLPAGAALVYMRGKLS